MRSINDKNCRFLAVFEKPSVVPTAQHFSGYSPTMPSDSCNAFKTCVAYRITSEAVGEIP
jgi:hypothetical protein